jgi:retron-type reverse transcriptase
MTDLAIWIDDERILRLILRWLRTFGWRGRGIAQGAPISPLLANLYLHPFDRLMAVNGWHVVRYADDFVVLTASAPEAEQALKDVARLLKGRGLALNPEKTQIVAPGETFQFLGRALTAGVGASAAAVMPAMAAAALPAGEATVA